MQQTKRQSLCQAESCWLLFVCLKTVQPSSLIKYSTFHLFFLYSKFRQRWAKQFQSNRMSPLAFMKHTVNRVHKAMRRPGSQNGNIINGKRIPPPIQSAAVLSGSL